ncbi:hypothetical protein [Azospirillum palustre]
MCCRAAVERAFAELVARGEPEGHAREAGLFIFRFHHPDASASEAAETVDFWTRPSLLH